MTAPQPEDGTVVRVETDRVDGVIPLDQLLARVQESAARRAAEAGPARPGADAAGGQEALTRISELAAQLSEELARLGPLDE
jgi:hypothetical protein